MGSGLILLVIVGAWLAVLVPVALRSHESASTASTVDAFHDAMRVLARREPVVRTGEQDGPRSVPAPLSPAARRQRLLLGLLAAVVVTLLGAVLGPGWLVVPHLVADALLLAYVGHLRHTVVLRRERARREQRGRRRSAQRLATERAQAPREVAAPRRRIVASRVAGVPEMMPSRAAVGSAGDLLLDGAQGVTLELRPDLSRRVTPDAPQELLLDARAPAPTPAPARGAQGAAWAPVPVPLPGYLTAPVAPRRAPRPAAREQVEAQHDGDGERRRAVND